MKVCFFGVGSLGANTAINLARRFGSDLAFHLVDYDRIEDVNKHNQPWYDVNVGQLKAVVLAAYLYRAAKSPATVRTAKVNTAEEFVNFFGNEMDDVDVFVDCFDNLPARNEAQKIADMRKTPILHSGFAESVMLCKWGTEFPLKNKSASTAPVCNRRELGPLVTLGASVTALVLGTYIAERRKTWAFMDISKGIASLTMG